MATAIQQFQITYGRAWSQIVGSTAVLDAFNAVAEEEEKPKHKFNQLHEASDMARFGIVLAVAAMDDFFTRKYAEALAPALKRHGINESFAKMLEEAGFDIASAINLLQMQRPYSRIRKIAQDHYSNLVTQSENRIDSLYETIGIKNLCEHAQRRSKRKNLLKSLNILVKRRHKIVHAGDIGRRGRVSPIDKTTINRTCRGIRESCKHPYR